MKLDDLYHYGFSDYEQLKKAGGHIGRNIVEITIKMKTIV